MVQISDLKANVDTQFRASINILDIAKDLNNLRKQLEQQGNKAEAEAMKKAIMSLIDQSDNLTESARTNGRTVVDALRDAW